MGWGARGGYKLQMDNREVLAVLLKSELVFAAHCSQKSPAEGKLYFTNCRDSFPGNAQPGRFPDELAALSAQGSVPGMTSSAKSAYTAIHRPRAGGTRSGELATRAGEESRQDPTQHHLPPTSAALRPCPESGP